MAESAPYFRPTRWSRAATGPRPGYDHEFPSGLKRLDRFASSRLAGLNERFLARATADSGSDASNPAMGPLRPAFEFLGYGLYHHHNGVLDGRHIERALARFLRTAPKRPLQLLINLMETHEPYVPSRFPASTPVDDGFFPAPNMSLFNRHLSAQPGAYPGFRRAYFEAARNLDIRLERIFGLLQRTGIWNDSLVVLVSDHGQCLGEHRFFGHGYEMYDELVRVPCLVWNVDASRADRSTSNSEDWIDHRHLHDLLLEYTTAPGRVVDPAWRERSLERRGPAMSYYEGTLSRPTPFSRPELSSTRRSSGRGPGQVRRIVRLCSGPHSVILGEGPGQGEPYPATSNPGNDAWQDLCSRAKRVLLAAGERGSRSPGSPADSGDVEERLKGWGYL